MQDWLWMTASDLGRKIGAGEIDPVDLTHTYLNAIETHDFGDRVYARLTADRAIAEATTASERAKSGFRLGLLDGVPISWKDLFDTAGTATEHGSALLKNRVPNNDARVLANATASGLVCLGKTHQTELAFSGLGYNPVTASPPCRNDHDAVAGGSSSGAATSVAFGLAAAGIGSDTGGSVRVPSVWNDLVGLKTTAGRVSCDGVLPLCASFDTIGPLTRSVEDAAEILAVLEGRKAPDLSGVDIQNLKFAVCESVAFEGAEGPVVTGFSSAVDRIEAAGATVQRITVPSVEEALPLSGALFAPEAYATWAAEIETNPDVMFQAVRERFQSGMEFSAVNHIKAWQKLRELRHQYLAQTSEFDAVLVPTCPIMPPKLAALAGDLDYFTERNLMALRNTRIGNLMGLTVLTLPTGLPSTGVSLMGAPMTEDRLLRVGSAVERALS